MRCLITQVFGLWNLDETCFSGSIYIYLRIATNRKHHSQREWEAKCEFIDFMLAWSDNRHFDIRWSSKLGNVSEFLLQWLSMATKGKSTIPNGYKLHMKKGKKLTYFLQMIYNRFFYMTDEILNARQQTKTAEIKPTSLHNNDDFYFCFPFEPSIFLLLFVSYFTLSALIRYATVCERIVSPIYLFRRLCVKWHDTPGICDKFEKVTVICIFSSLFHFVCVCACERALCIKSMHNEPMLKTRKSWW